MRFPTTFSETLTPVAELPGHLDERGTRALGRLAALGFEVVSGVRQADVPQISAIARQRGVREFCPKDQTTRFADEAVMAAWFQKDNGVGRAMFLLRCMPTLVDRLTAPLIVGYGWTGPTVPQPGEPNYLPLANTTFALRISENIGVRGMGVPFTEAMVSATVANFDETSPEVAGFDRAIIGLDTWQDNRAAVITYERAGAVLVAKEETTRMTLGPAPNETPYEIDATRLHMYFADTLNPSDRT